MMRVSVIVPCYQAGAFLQDCLRSLLSQDFAGMEVLCVDDGSTDQTPRILRQAAADPRVRVWRSAENQGVARARTLGLSKARGDYVLFVDADDQLLPGALHKLYDTACRQRADIVSADHMLWFPDGQTRRESLEREGEDTLSVLRSLVRLEGLYNNQCNKLIHRQLFTRNRIAPVPDIKLGEDVLLNLALYQAASRFSHLHEPTYLYRKHEAAATARVQDGYNDHLPMLLEMRKWLLASPYGPELADEYLYSAMWLLQKYRGIRHTVLDYSSRVLPLARGIPKVFPTPQGRRTYRLVDWHLFRWVYLCRFLWRKARGLPLRQIPPAKGEGAAGFLGKLKGRIKT